MSENEDNIEYTVTTTNHYTARRPSVWRDLALPYIGFMVMVVAVCLIMVYICLPYLYDGKVPRSFDTFRFCMAYIIVFGAWGIFVCAFNYWIKVGRWREALRHKGREGEHAQDI